MRYGLIGEKLGHSYSKIIHEKIADYTYDLLPLSREEFKVFMDRRDFTAINVTIPYKQAVIPYLDELEPLAKEIGAVNTIVNRGGHYIGYNTDFFGYLYMLEHNGIRIKDKKCLILGSGGTSHTVSTVFKHLGASQVLIVSRQSSEAKRSSNEGKSSVSGQITAFPIEKPANTQTISYEECYAGHLDAQIIANTTPLGMYPNINASPIDLTSFTHCEAVVDAIFNPLETRLTLQAKELGRKGVTGLWMLVAQAKQAIEYFLDTRLEDQVIEDTYHYLLDVIRDKR